MPALNPPWAMSARGSAASCRVSCWQLPPSAIQFPCFIKVPGAEVRRTKPAPRRAESDARKRSEDCSSDDRGTQLLPQTKYAHRFHLSPLFRSRVGQCPTPCNVRRKDIEVW